MITIKHLHQRQRARPIHSHHLADLLGYYYNNIDDNNYCCYYYTSSRR